MEEQLKQVLGRTDSYLDFHSVVDGFRDVGLIGLVEHHDSFNQSARTRIPSLSEQQMFIHDYLRENRACYFLIHGWRHLYFIAKQDREKDIEILLKDHPIPVESKEGERRLGLLLSFPECCVVAHNDDKETRKRSGFYVVPFTPCSRDCERPWVNEYYRLAERYKIDPKMRFINGNK